MTAIPIWTIYDHPIDYPDHWVARLWMNDQPTEEIRLADSLEELRNRLPPGLVCLSRHQADDPKIVEVWL